MPPPLSEGDGAGVDEDVGVVVGVAEGGGVGVDVAVGVGFFVGFLVGVGSGPLVGEPLGPVLGLALGQDRISEEGSSVDVIPPLTHLSLEPLTMLSEGEPGGFWNSSVGNSASTLLMNVRQIWDGNDPPTTLIPRTLNMGLGLRYPTQTAVAMCAV